MAVEQTGLEFVAENINNFLSATGEAATAVTGFTDVGAIAADSYNAVEEIITGALRHIGEIAVDSLLQAGQAIKDFASGSIEEALDAEKNLASLNAVIKSTGGAAGVTAEDAQELAMRFRDLAGGSDDAVLAIEEVALRAGNVSKEELPDFIQQTLDLAQVMGSTEAAAILLSRSEEDVAGAMGKAQKKGIIFSKELQDQIKLLVKDGKTKEANELFTNRLAEATSGLAASAAETTSGKWEILTGHFKEFQETVGAAIIPGLNMLFDNVIRPAMPLLEEFASSIANIITLMLSGDFKGGIFGLQEDDPIIDFIFDVRDGLISLGQWIITNGVPAFNSLTDWIQNTALPAFFAFSDWIQTVAIPGLFALSDWFTREALPAIQPVLDALGDIFNSFKNNDPDAFTEALDNLFAAFNGLWEKYLQPALTDMWNKFSAWIVEQAGIIKDEFFNHWRPALIEWVDDALPPFLDKLGEFIGAGLAWLITTGIPDFVNSLIEGLQFLFGLKQVDMEEAGKGFFGGFIRGFSADEGWDKIKETLAQLAFIIIAGLESASEAAIAIVNGIGLVIGASLQHMSDGLKDYVDGFYWAGADLAKGIADGIRDAAGAIYDALSGAVQSAIDNVLNVFDMHSPSLVTANIIGSPLAEGIAEGIMSSMKSVRAALGEGIVSSVATVSQMMGGGGSSYSNSNSWNLNVNSNQNSQGIIQDFSIMQTMAV